jgi:hypothetical protein
MKPLAKQLERRVVDNGADKEPTGPMILMLASGEGYAVVIDPPMPTGNHRSAFFSKIDAWNYAQGLWCDMKIGCADHSTGNERRTATGPYRSQI